MTLDPKTLLAIHDDQLRRNAPWEGVERADGVVRQVTDGWRGVLWSDLDASNADAVIARELGRFAPFDAWEWKLYSHDQPPDLADRLRAAGFVAEETETLLVGVVAELRLDSPLPPGVVLRRVDDEAAVAAVVHVHEAVFGGEYSAMGRRLLAATRAGQQEAIVAMAGGVPVSSGRVEFNPGTEFASLWGGGTLPEWRGRGIFRAIVAARARLAAERGYRYLQVDASDDSNPILQRLGFVPIATTTPFVHHR